ncbi:hypothetical protein GGR57DRAFT_318863 [Xylariaceae sp. FL1272]|nr:hypothetical protein GGR57DRAFT_318863 [Xylariaceae sp. FL1272]
MATVNLARPPVVTLARVEQVENWFNSEGRNVHAAYNEESYWLTEEQRFESGQEPLINKLKKLLVLYQGPQNLTASAVQPTFNICDCSWDDVLAQLELAKSSCVADCGKGYRKADRFLAKAASYTEKWLDLLPDEYGLSVVRGGLALVFSMATTKIENRDKIVQAFEDIPDMIRTIETACKIFQSDEDENIAAIAKDLYDGLCTDIPDLIHIVEGKGPKLKRLLNRLAAGAPQTEKIDGILDRVKTRSKRLETSIERIKMRLDGKQRSDISAIRQSAEATHAALGVIDHKVSQIPKRADWEIFAQGFGQFLMRAMRQEFQNNMQEMLKAQDKGDLAAEAKTQVLMMIHENQRLENENAMLTAQNQRIEHDRSRLPLSIAGLSLSAFDLMRILDVDARHSIEDLGFVLKQSFRMGPEEVGRARWLMKATQFQNWMNGLCHQLLMADGAMRLEKVSPMSIFTATMATSLLQVPSFIVLHFFGGKNLDPDAEDELPGPQGMVRSLISQLILNFTPSPPNLSEINTPEFIRELQHWGFRALSEVLRILITQLPPSTTLYILLDGISYYEQGQWLSELQYFIGLLRHIMSRPSGPYLKVLMTNAGRSTEIKDMLNMEWEYISLAAGNIDYMPLVSPSILEAMSPSPGPRF